MCSMKIRREKSLRNCFWLYSETLTQRLKNVRAFSFGRKINANQTQSVFLCASLLLFSPDFSHIQFFVWLIAIYTQAITQAFASTSAPALIVFFSDSIVCMCVSVPKIIMVIIPLFSEVYTKRLAFPFFFRCVVCHCLSIDGNQK